MNALLKKSVIIIGIVLAIAALAWPKITQLRAAKLAATSAGSAKGTPPPPLKVLTFTVVPRKFEESITVTGSLRAEEGVDLQVEVSGKVVSINFIEGTAVKKGELLLKINDSELQAALNRAVYRKQIVELKEQRIAPLLKTGGVPQQDYDAIVSDLNVQKSEIELINAQIEKSEIRAPFDGIIGLRFISEGAFITATSNAPVRIATLQAIRNLKVDFNIPERYAGRIKVGTPLTFTVAGGTNKFHGEVYAIEPRIDLTTRTILLRGLCPNPGGVLIPGAFANVECPISSVDDAILVPSVAVISGLSEKNVFVVKDGKVVRKSVEIGTRTENTIHVISGLAQGDQVITSAIQQMRPGLAVQVANEALRPAPDGVKAGGKKNKGTPATSPAS